MLNSIPNGVWPTMITPFTDSNNIDYKNLERMIEWYMNNKVDGLFAVCQSSEMFYLSLKERINLARFVKEKTYGHIPVIASGHVSGKVQEQIDEIKRICDTGIDSFVLVSNRLASQDESVDVWKKNAEKILSEVPEIPFGIYECPYPYKRLMSPELLQWCSSTGRFLFHKDTSRDIDQLKAKVEAVRKTRLKIFNANTATFLESLKCGAAGFSGVMANFHPDLYVWLCQNWQTDTRKAEIIQNFLGVASLVELQLYPINAKYHLKFEEIEMSLHSRSKNAEEFSSSNRMEVEQLFRLTENIKAMLFL